MGRKNFSPAPGQRFDTSVHQPSEYFFQRNTVYFCKIIVFDGGKPDDVHIRLYLFNAPQHIFEIVEGQFRMETTHNVHLIDAHGNGTLNPFFNFL